MLGNLGGVGRFFFSRFCSAPEPSKENEILGYITRTIRLENAFVISFENFSCYLLSNSIITITMK